MDKLQSIWNEMNNEQIGSTELNSSRRNSIINNLKQESDLRKKYKPFIIILIMAIFALFYFIIKKQEGTISITKFIGILMITISGLSVFYFSQRVKVDFNKVELDYSATEFIKLCNTYIKKARKDLVIGVLLQLFCLTIGLYLLIFLDNPNYHVGYKYGFLGFMGGLAGLGIGGSISSFNKHYKGFIDIINKFSHDDQYKTYK